MGSNHMMSGVVKPWLVERGGREKNVDCSRLLTEPMPISTNQGYIRRHLKRGPLYISAVILRDKLLCYGLTGLSWW